MPNYFPKSQHAAKATRSINLHNFLYILHHQQIKTISINLLANFGDQELCKRLAVTVGAAIVLLGLHFVHNHLGSFHFLQYLRLHFDIFQVWPTNLEFAILLQCQDTTQLYFAAWGSLPDQIQRNETCKSLISVYEA
jgi:hypothetical protein